MVTCPPITRTMRARRLTSNVAWAVAAAALLVGADAGAAEPGWDEPARFAEAHRYLPAYVVDGGGGTTLVLRHGGLVDGVWEEDAVYVDEFAGAARSRPEQRLAPSAPHGGHLASGEDGAALAVWATDEELRAARRAPGSAFGEPFALPQAELGGPTLAHAAVDAAGGSVVLFVQRDGGNERVWATRSDAGDTFGPPIAVSEEIYGSVWGLVARTAADGEVVAAWFENTWSCPPEGGVCTPRRRLLAAVAEPGGTFSPPQQLEELYEAPGSEISLGVDERGGAVVGWHTGSDRERATAVAVRPPAGQFGSARVLGGGDVFGPHVVGVSSDGRFAAVYLTGSPFDPIVTLVRGTTAGAFGEPRAIEHGRAPMVAVGPGGDTLVAWWGRGTRVAWSPPDGSGGAPRDIACGAFGRLDAALVRGSEVALLWRSSNDPVRDQLGISRGSASIPVGERSCSSSSPPPPSSYPPIPPEGSPHWWNPHWPWRDVLFSPPPRAGADPNAPPAWANGASTRPVFSQDNRRVRLIAFESHASNLVARDRNRVRDVFVIRRGTGGGNMTGRIERASVGPGGREANGPSSDASLDGETRARPRCVAFESTATNLDARDRSRDADVYLRDLRRRTTRLVSVRRTEAVDPVVDGRCRSVTFGSGGWVWVGDVRSGRAFRLARGGGADQQTNGEGAAYERSGQVWHRSFELERRGGRVRLRRGRERLVSDSATGRPGNGVSSNPAADDAGHYVAFESTATNLCEARCAGISEDRNGPVKDVFRRTLSARAPTRDVMQMVSFSYAVGEQGNGASEDPAISGAGENVVFVSESTNLRRHDDAVDANGRVRDVFSWTFPRRRGYGNVVRFARYGCIRGCRGPSEAPSMSSRGNYVAFAAPMTEHCVPGRQQTPFDRPCPSFADVFVRFVGPSHEGYPLG
jgi:hypothetical protein